VGPELVVDGIDPRALVILDVTRGENVEDGERAARGRIFVYQRNVERAAGSLDGIEDELLRALEHEISHVFAGPSEPLAPEVDRDKLN
jgi:hypothetical protein